MKRLLSIVLIICLILSLCSCSANKIADGCSADISSTETVSDISDKSDASYVGSQLPQSTQPSVSAIDVNVKLPTGYTGTKEQYIEEQNERFYAMDSDATSPEGLLTRSYPEKEIVGFINHLTREKYTTLYELDNKYPVEYIQFDFSKPKLLDFQAAHCAYKLNEGGYLYVVLHSSELAWNKSVFGNCIMVERVVIKDSTLSIEAFDGIKKGSSLSDIEKIDKGTARLNAIRTDYLDAGCVYFDDALMLKYALPGTIHVADGALIIIVYEDPKDNNGEYIVKHKNVIDEYLLSISEYFVDHDKVRTDWILNR